MTHIFENEKTWNALSADEKLDALNESIKKLFGIVEEYGHKNHLFVDAINLIHNRLDHQAKVIRALHKYPNDAELVE